MIPMVRYTGLFFLLAFLVLISVPRSAAQGEHDPERLIDLPDNPTGRGEFERLKRADPATGRIPDNMRRRELEFAAAIPSRERLALEAEGKGAVAAGAVTTWHERGPVNQGGRTRALAVDRTDERVLLAGGVSGGLWRSQDTGKTWVRVTAIDEIHSVTCIRQDPRPGAAGVWYYGTGEWRANSANLPGDGIFKSTDGGRSWNRLASTVRNTPQSRDQVFDYVHRIEIDPSNPDQDEIYAACYGGIARSVDGGETWETVLGNLGNSTPYSDVAVTSAGVVYATISSGGRTRRGIWRSEDGVNWTQITPPNFPTSYNKLSIGIAPSNESLVYFFGETTGAGKNDHSLWVYREQASGPVVWEDRSAALPGNVETYASYCVVVRVKPDDENTVFLGHVNCMRSTDGFRDTANVSQHMGSGQHADQHEYVFFPSNPDMMLAGHDGGLSVARDNTAGRIEWESLNSGFVTTQFYSVAIDHAQSGSRMIVGGTQDNGSWFINSGEDLAEWRKVLGADGGYCAIADSGTSFYFSYQNGQLFRSVLESDGKSLGTVRIDPEGGDDYLFIHPYTLDPSDTRIMYLPEGKNLWRNSDLTAIPLNGGGGKKTVNWTKLENAEVPADAGDITAVGVSRNNPPHRLYYATARGRIFRLDNADTTAAAATEISGNYFPNGYVQSVAVDPHDGDKVLVAISSYNLHSLFYTADGGNTWDTVGGNLEENPNGQGNGPSVGWVAVLPVRGKNVYFAGTTTGLYSATALNGMNTFWAQEGASTIGNIVIDMIDVRESDGFVVAGSHGRGVFSGHVLPELVQATLVTDPLLLDFGGVPVGSTVPDTLAIGNAAGSARSMRISVPQVGGVFSVASGTGSYILPPGGTHHVVVAFSPDSATLYSEPLQISHDGTSPQTPSTLWLVGQGKSTAGIEERKEITGEGMGLSGYPNPFSKSVVLRFAVKERGEVLLKILAANGAEVAVPFRGRMEAGDHSVTWSPASAANGVYYVHLEIGGEGWVIPVVLER